MTLTLLNLYNSAASQEWSMYDNDASTTSELEDSLVTALNKSILEIYYSYEFPFRERTQVILTIPKVQEYDLPQGLIKRNINGKDCILCNTNILENIEDTLDLTLEYGIPEKFYIKSDKIYFYPIPVSRNIITIDYYTLAIGETSTGTEIFSLTNATDILSVPAYLEELMREAVISRTMLNTIASESDENYSAYKKQADKAYKLLVKYSKGVGKDKVVKM